MDSVSALICVSVLECVLILNLESPEATRKMKPAQLPPRISTLCARALQVTERTFPAPVLGDTLLDGGDLEPVDVLDPLEDLVVVLDHVMAGGKPQTRAVGRCGGISIDVHLPKNTGTIRDQVLDSFLLKFYKKNHERILKC